ncbi:HET-domain-containing protein [Decorospora gaudefroyi]|uniref:HET-domain-containing protein n=1 Tax=Decorospora gaudefroyi TaxID=184978 RepID=A0A6A5JWX3_9PLEO|nr:HET-domain-containing protein [Decorospora gaudefroyi]
MRLINASTFEVEEFLPSSLPEYVILSHTWGAEEVTLQDVQSGEALRKNGYAKITGCCKKAAADGFNYCWIDTCCIDKTSSAELSEAINSITNVIEFYNAFWVDLGTRLSLHKHLKTITGIDDLEFSGSDTSYYTVAERMSWAAGRRTSRLEDTAYCLMGIFSVNMPLLYGEGARAFGRLQEEILRNEEDYTMFAWTMFAWTRPETKFSGVLASSPDDFSSFDPKWASDFEQPIGFPENWSFKHLLNNTSIFLESSDFHPPILTSRGLRITLPIFELENGHCYACLTTSHRIEIGQNLLCIKLSVLEPDKDVYIRRYSMALILLPMTATKRFKFASIYVRTRDPESTNLHGPLLGGGPPLLLVRIDPALSVHLVRVASGLVSLHHVLQKHFGEDVYPSILPNLNIISPNWEVYEKPLRGPMQLKYVAEVFHRRRETHIDVAAESANTYFIAFHRRHGSIGFHFNDGFDIAFWVKIKIDANYSKLVCSIKPTNTQDLGKGVDSERSVTFDRANLRFWRHPASEGQPHVGSYVDIKASIRPRPLVPDNGCTGQFVLTLTREHGSTPEEMGQSGASIYRRLRSKHVLPTAILLIGVEQSSGKHDTEHIYARSDMC